MMPCNDVIINKSKFSSLQILHSGAATPSISIGSPGCVNQPLHLASLNRLGRKVFQIVMLPLCIFFMLMFSNDIMEHTIDQTNLYAM